MATGRRTSSREGSQGTQERQPTEAEVMLSSGSEFEFNGHEADDETSTLQKDDLIGGSPGVKPELRDHKGGSGIDWQKQLLDMMQQQKQLTLHVMEVSRRTDEERKREREREREN